MMTSSLINRPNLTPSIISNRYNQPFPSSLFPQEAIHLHCLVYQSDCNGQSSKLRKQRQSALPMRARLSESQPKRFNDESEAMIKEKLSNISGVVTDSSVPEGHVGLHGFLYGDSGADIHDADEESYAAKEGEDDGSTMLPSEEYISSRSGRRFAGVYGVYDKNEQLQYVGYSRNVLLSLRGHVNGLGADMCAFVKVKVYLESSLITRARLEEEQKRWIDSNGAVPLGNSTNIDLWQGPNGPGTAAMTEDERNAYEEKKLKMRKAMGENLFDDVEGEADDAKQRRLNLLRATEGDDWSSVIDGQTKETVTVPKLASDAPADPSGSSAEVDAEVDAPPASPSQIVSPFMRPGFSSDASAISAPDIELTIENVDRTLDEVRPYLIADGGNVEVVSVENGYVYLRLQGACGTCPSSTATMKMGLEAALKKKFGDKVKDVMQVDKIDTRATIQAVNSHLDMLRPAINNFGGEVQVLSVDNLKGHCEVKYRGPPPIGMGIQAAIKDKFPDIRVVKLTDF